MNIECEENMKLTLSKCTAYCEKINKFSEVLTAYSDKESQEEIIFGTLKNVLKEKRQIRVSFQIHFLSRTLQKIFTAFKKRINKRKLLELL